jgi:hypothetical protein
MPERAKFAAASHEPEYITRRGGTPATRQAHSSGEPEWQGIGVLYCRKVKGVIEFRVLYGSHISTEIKDVIAEQFGAGALEWKICG